MIFSFELNPGHYKVVRAGTVCGLCDKPVSHEERSIVFHLTEAGGRFVILCYHVKCAEHVSLMMMRDVAEVRCGEEIANARYRKIREIVPHP
jgi:hypothetical protein